MKGMYDLSLLLLQYINTDYYNIFIITTLLLLHSIVSCSLESSTPQGSIGSVSLQPIRMD